MLYLHFYSLIPINNISTKCKRFNMNYMYVALFRSNIKPFATDRQMQVCDSAGIKMANEKKKLMIFGK